MNILFSIDGYKLSHRNQFPKGTEVICSNLTARKSRIDGVDEVVVFGVQKFVQDLQEQSARFFDAQLENIVSEYRDTISQYLNVPYEEVEVDHIVALHKLGYLPIHILSMPEGSKVKIGDPILLIYNTHPDFFWLTNYLETWMSNSLWGPITSATTARRYRQILDEYAAKTSSSPEFVNWQGHDFSMRGMWGNEAAAMSGAGHLLFFNGTDTIPAVKWIERVYGETPVAGSVPASEHSVMCAGSAHYSNGNDVRNGELELYRKLITEVYPTGILSIVMDSYDYFGAITEFLPLLKNDILNRNGKIVCRPDTGDPVEVICGIEIENAEDCENFEEFEDYVKDVLIDRVQDETPHGEHGDEQAEGLFRYDGKIYKGIVDIEWNRHDKQYYYVEHCFSKLARLEEYVPTPEEYGSIELLWNIFGGTINEKGYKELDPHIGLIYGDSITVDRAKEICRRLEAKGFASTNIVLGIGSYTYTYVTRDTFGMAVKATYAEVNGKAYPIFKWPKGDSSKKSHRGIPIHWETGVTDGHCLQDLKKPNLYVTKFFNGKVFLENWTDVKRRANK